MARTKKGIGPLNRAPREIRNVIGYVRISKKRDHQSSVSTEETIGTQNGRIEKAADDNDWHLVEILGDIGISAFDTSKERPDFERAIQMIERGQADAIVVFKLDRFSRSIVEFHKAWERIKAAGGHFISLTEGFDTSNPWGEAMMGIIAIFAQMESTMKRERALPAIEDQKESGAVGPGPRPYGYDKVTSKQTKNSAGNSGAGAVLTINERERALIRTAADWVLDGGSLLSFISDHQPDSSRANVKMTYRGLKHVLTNATTAGLREWADAPDGTGFQPGCWEAILPRDDWDRLREILLDPARRTSPNGGKRAHLLSGVMTCDECGKGFTSRNWVHPKTREITKRYQCGNIGKCYNSIDQASAHSVVMDELWETVSESQWATWQAAGKGWDPAVIVDIESRMAFTDKQFTAGRINESRWAEMMGELEEQLASAQNGEPLDIPQVPSLRESWDDFDLADKQRVLRMAFESIGLRKQNGSRDPRTRIAFNGVPVIA